MKENIVVRVNNQKEYDEVCTMIEFEYGIPKENRIKEFDSEFPFIYSGDESGLYGWSEDLFSLKSMSYEEYIKHKTPEPVRVGKVARTNWYKLRNYR